jgi:hypothetical protein
MGIRRPRQREIPPAARLDQDRPPESTLVWTRPHRGAIRRDDPQRAAWSAFLIGSGLMFGGEIAPGLGWFASTRPPGFDVFVNATQAELLGRYCTIEKPHQTMRSPDASGKPRSPGPLTTADRTRGVSRCLRDRVGEPCQYRHRHQQGVRPMSLADRCRWFAAEKDVLIIE